MKKGILLIMLLLSGLSANENRMLFYGNCIACHGEIRKPSAPHFAEIKGYYMLKYPTKEAFVEKMSKWVFRPNEKTAQLPHAIKKYRLMPFLSIDLDTLEKIATYIYENNDFMIAL
ncbi:MAG: cytochrome C [Sulfurovum sp.]|nr:MAG: cytochrome C [Sulfurovum sp.]